MKVSHLLAIVAVACLPLAYAVPCVCVNGECDVDTGLCVPGTCLPGFTGDLCTTPLLDFVNCPAGTTSAVVSALRTFYDHMGGPGWANNDGWSDLGNNDPCTWFGVVCNPSNPCEIQELSLPSNNLVLTGVSECDFDSLNTVHSIKWLDLGRNAFGGPLSPKIANMLSLQTLYMNDNDMNGEIPSTISLMPLLKYVDLSNNEFTGPLPSFDGSAASLMYLYLNNNLLQGPWTDQLSLNEFLKSIWLNGNCMVGELPDWLSLTLFPHLTELRAANTGMSVDGIPADLLEALKDLLVLTVGGEKSCNCPPLQS